MPSPMRIDPELTRSADAVASKMSRSVPEQIAHWARIGRELERSPELSVAEIRKVLDGAASYDSLAPRAQALVRAAWLDRIQALAADLDLPAEFKAAGHGYAEADERGRVTIHEPKATYRKRATRRVAGR